MVTALCVPQWQGSSAAGARRLAVGAHRTAAQVSADAVVTVPVRADPGEFDQGVRALDVLVDNLALTRTALAGIDGPVLTAGGECGVDLAPIAAARARYGDDLTVLWFDAHPDLYTPRTLPSGSFHGMVLRTLLGDGPDPLVPADPLRPEQVVIAGVRAGDRSEHAYLRSSGIRGYGVADLEHAVEGLTGPVYVHVDLDVLEPTTFASVGYPEPDGVTPDRLADLLAGIDNVVGAAITEHAPPDDVANATEEAIIHRLAAALRF
ncbi:arginase [Asanoa ishikariensis]|uniref:Arginase n=1 Tax=Asanoa ishikariensis TaxID=137265 RepID=A0A1H3RW37_9ACTN|nr:arginase family protein [Asanoa ishikariensis]GIF66835.1 arginase [Asanoa ishikariensis]SDZ29079.1 arginase [Asanoa ishikariensis]